MEKIYKIKETLPQLTIEYELNKGRGPEHIRELEIAKRYWLRDVDGNWVFEVSELASEFGVSESEFPKIIYDLIHAEHLFDTGFDCRCDVCGENAHLVTRENFQTSYDFSRAHNTFVCYFCLATEDFVTEDGLLDDPDLKELVSDAASLLNNTFQDKNKVTKLIKENYDFNKICLEDAIFLYSILIVNQASWNGKTFTFDPELVSKIHALRDGGWNLIDQLAERGIIYSLVPKIEAGQLMHFFCGGEIEPEGEIEWHIATSDKGLDSIDKLMSFLDSVLKNAIKRLPEQIVGIYSHLTMSDAFNTLLIEGATLNLNEELENSQHALDVLTSALQGNSTAKVKSLIRWAVSFIKSNVNLERKHPKERLALVLKLIEDETRYGREIEKSKCIIEESTYGNLAVTNRVLYEKVLGVGPQAYFDWTSRGLLNNF